MHSPIFAVCDPHAEKSVPYTIPLCSGLPTGMHSIEVSLRTKLGMTYRHTMTFFGTGCSMQFYGDLGSMIDIRVDGMIMPSVPVFSIAHNCLLSLLRKLIQQHSTKTPYIMES